MTENVELVKAWRIAMSTDKSLFLTGKAGTGKTTFLKKLRKECPKNIIVAAPTGIAAINAEGVTLHSLFQLPFTPYIPGTPFAKYSTNKFSKKKIRLLCMMDMLVIDEISMVRADVMDAIDMLLRRFRHKQLPFGGVQLLMIGDLQQLSPVATHDVWNILSGYYDTPYFFSSRALSEANFTTIELKQIFRQTDPVFLNLLNQVRNNTLSADALKELNTRYIPNFTPSCNQKYIHLTTHNHQAQSINQAELDKISHPEYQYNAIVKGDFPENIYPTEHTLTLKLGAQVMFVKNDSSPERRFYNGMIGNIIDIDKNGFSVKTVEPERTILVEPMKWSNTKYILNEKNGEIQEEEIGTFIQYPVKTAWAITIHKSQGLTFKYAIIDAQDSFAHGQVYVALSRCKSLQGMVLSTPLSSRSIITDHQVKSFTQFCQQLSPHDNQLTDWERESYTNRVNELFDFTPTTHLLAKTLNYLQSHFSKVVPHLIVSYQSALTHFHEKAIQVAQKFRNQYVRIINENQDYSTLPQLQERFSKAAEYFIPELQQLIPLLDQTIIPTDNKEHKSNINELVTQLHNNLNIKIRLLEHIISTGFEPNDYLKLSSWLEMNAESKPITDKKASRTKTTKEKIQVPTGILHPQLYEQLIEWRKKRASEVGRPVYNVIQQKALIGMVNLLPLNAEELLMIPHFGKYGVDNFGEEILEIIHSYIANHQIDKSSLLS